MQRASRRVAARRTIVQEQDDDSSEEIEVASFRGRDDEDEDGEFSQAPARTPTARASPRRKTTEEGRGPPRRRTAAGRRTQTDEPLEPSQVFSPPQSVIEEPISPPKKAPPKRRSVKDARAARKSRVSQVSIATDAPDVPPPLPTQIGRAHV